MSGFSGIYAVWKSLEKLSIFLSMAIAISACNPTQTHFDHDYFPGVSLSYSNSIVSSASAVVLQGLSVKIVLSLKDEKFNPYISTLPQVTFQTSGGTSTGSFGPVTNRGDGTYAADFTGLTSGTATTVTAVVNGMPLLSSAVSIQVAAGNYSVAQSVISVSSTSVASSSSVTVTLTTKDSLGNPLTAGGLGSVITFTQASGTSTGTFSAVVDHNDGTYTSQFTGVTSGTAATIGATMNAVALTSVLPTVTVNPGPATQLVFTTQPGNGIRGSSLATQPVVTVKDAAGNKVITGADSSASIAMTLASGAGSIGGTATRTASSGVATFTNLSFTANGSKTLTATATLNGISRTVTSNSITIDPPAPGAFTISSAVGSSGQVVLTWGSAADVSTYSVNYGTTSGSYPTSFSTNATSPLTVTGLTNGVRYYFMVSAVNVTGTTQATSEIFSDTLAAPSAPSALAVTVGQSSAALAWTASTGGGSITYNVYRSTTSGSYSTALATGLTTNSYSDTTAANGTAYYYIVRAINAGGTSSDSNESSAPALTIGAPTAVSVINSAGQASVTVSGSCSFNGGTVTVKATKGASVVSGTSTCSTSSSPQFSTTLDVSTIGDGTLVFSATEVSGAHTGAAATVSVLKDVVGPAAATALGWTQTSPTSATTISASWTKSADSDLSTQKIQLYSDAACATTSGSLIDVALLQTKDFTQSAGAYSFKILSYDAYGNANSSACSSAISIDTTAPALSSSFTMSVPTFNTASAYPTLSFSATSGSDVGATATSTNLTQTFYWNDCTGANIGTKTVAPSTSFSFVTSSVTGADGVRKLFYTATDAAGNVSACTDSGLYYTYQGTPKVSFTQSAYTIRESVGGTKVGSDITLHRDVCGVITTVPITTTDVTAVNGTNYVAGTFNVVFAASDCSDKTVALSNFGIKNDSATTGDLFFKASIGSITNGVGDSSKQAAQVNLADSATVGDYLFTQPLFTAAAGASSVTLTVQKAGGVTTASSVDVAFVDAAGAASTDYTSTTQTLNFASGVDEVSITVPVVNNSKNVSFIAKLVNPSTGTSVRNASVAKIRIMNEANVCTATTIAATPFAGGTGTLGNPYQICSLAQLKRINSYLSSSFKLMTDIQADTSLVPLGTLTGNFDGNEFSIDGFSYSATTANQGLFNQANTGTSIKGLNLLNLVAVNTADYTGGIVGYMNGTALPTLSDLLVSGLVSGGSNYTGLFAGSIALGTSGTPLISIHHSVSLGKVKGGNGVAGMVGYIFGGSGGATYTNTFSNLYNGASIVASAVAVGGIIGWANMRGLITMSSLENRGYISGAFSVGGIIGVDQPLVASTPSANYTDFVNYGAVVGASNRVGGVSGTHSNFYNVTISNFKNYGAVSGASTGIGGIYGSMDISNAFTFSGSNLTNNGTIVSTSTTTGGISGIIGVANASVNAVRFEITNAVNNGNVTAPRYAGGIVGEMNFSASSGTPPTNNFFSLTNSSNTGTITATLSPGAIGGVVGYLHSTAAADPQYTLNNVQSSVGTIACGTIASFCGGILGQIDVLGTQTSTISNSTSSSPVTGVASLGGFIGAINENTGASTLTLSKNSASGSVTGTGTYVGGLIGAIINSSGSFSLTGSSATGAVTTTSTAAGGLVGYLKVPLVSGASASHAISTSFASGNVSAQNSSGGLVGYVQMLTSSIVSIANSYAWGTVAGTNASNPVSGFVGYASDSVGGDVCKVNLTNVYTLSLISGGSARAGLINLNGCTSTIATSYWLKDTGINSTVTSDSNAQSATALQTSGTYSGWGFGTVWNAPAPYPTLK